MQRYALARPNARSSHVTPTAQGGGLAIIIATIAVIALTWLFSPQFLPGPRPLYFLLAATILMATVGAIDDVRQLPVFPRLACQAAATLLLLASLPPDMRLLPGWLPGRIELLIIAGAIIWFINLTNFMDGIDGITIAEMLPIALAIALFSALGATDQTILVPALVLAGGLAGFAPFNQHRARLFLGDVGSLPIGLLIAWLLLMLASSGYLAAALLLPLYYLMDATITLLWRVRQGQNPLQSHRHHFYQYATVNGLTVQTITRRILGLNLILAMLALLTVLMHHWAIDLAGLAGGVLATALVLRSFTRAPAATAPEDI